MAEKRQSSMGLSVVPMAPQHELTLTAFPLKSSELMEFPLPSPEPTNYKIGEKSN